VLAAAGAAARTGSVIEAHVVRALAHAAHGGSASAERDLCAALTAGYPVGYRRLFLGEGAELHGMLREVARTQSGDVAAWARQLLSDAVPAPGSAQRPAPTAIEGLSDREVEVLRLLATDLTGPEIARRLFVSLNTLRTHTKHIFTKLGVNSRRAAVGRAAELGVL
jgi:LuxR family maltose regulon positive regulatory protein